jgi:S-(hydroxymethyl)glutathione dehydrogenase/alcohol dehydrogenase
MKTLAAVLVESGKLLVLAELEIPALKPGQALVEIRFSGVCHTQLLECRGHRGEDRFLPHCLGHEGSGVVLETGAGVSKVKPGDAVILSWLKGSGQDVPFTTYRWGDRVVNAGAITTFARHAVIGENRLTPLPEGTPLREAALLGCAVPTGVGAVLNAAQPREGQSAVVFGAGGIGLCAVAGAAAAGCRPVVAVDVKPDKLDVARRLGATHAVNAAEGDPLPAILKLCPGGTDIAVEATGRPAVMRQALEAVRPRGGAAVVVGNARHGERVEIDPWHLNQGKRLLGTWGGDSVPDRDFPRYAEWIRSRRLDLSPLLSTPYRLEDVNTALDDLEAGRVIRPMVEPSL